MTLNLAARVLSLPFNLEINEIQNKYHPLINIFLAINSAGFRKIYIEKNRNELKSLKTGGNNN